jgi:hypothetical protein
MCIHLDGATDLDQIAVHFETRRTMPEDRA